MTARILHISGPSRSVGVASIVGDQEALQALNTALEHALLSGSGGTFGYHSDGESYLITVSLEADMSNVCTAYACEVTQQRSLRETVPISMVKNHAAAFNKALGQSVQFQSHNKILTTAPPLSSPTRHDAATRYAMDYSHSEADPMSGK